MELIENLLRKIKRGDRKSLTREHVVPIETWNYHLFREYLLSLTRGKDFLLPVDQYPNAIELSNDWHEVLDKMRTDSRDGHERWALIGYKEDRRGIYLPTIAAKGLPDHVPAEVMLEERDRAKVKAGITGLLGDLHSHPKGLVKDIWGASFEDLFDELFKEDSEIAIFSAGDLYCMVIPGSFNLMRGVVQGRENLFAFRTRESTDLGISQNVFRQDAFEKYWYEKNRFRYLGNVKNFGVRRIQALTSHADPWNVNTGIAERHKLVLYKGSSGANLTKVFSPNK